MGNGTMDAPPNQPASPPPPEVEQSQNEPEQQLSRALQTRQVAQFFLDMETTKKVTRSACQGLHEGLSILIDSTISRLQKEVASVLGNTDENQLQLINKIFDSAGSHNWKELSSDYLRHKFYRNKLCHVGIVKVPMILKKPGPGYYVPLEEQLTAIFSLPEMKGRRNPQLVHGAESPVFRDYTHGTYCRNHPLRDSDFFVQLLLHYDEVEIQNPLRSSKYHKMGMFYFSLVNIEPRFRSQLRSIFLVAMVPSFHMKKDDGVVDLLLENFVSTVIRLKTTGIEVSLNGEEVNMKGDLIAVLCDTPAAGMMGGFKESVSANKPCRMCHANKQSLKETFRERDFEIRSMASYRQECQLIEEASKKYQKEYLTKAFGVNRLSILANIPDFPVTSNILQDPMHDLLEGAYAQCLAMLLQKKCLFDKLFSLKEINDFFTEFDYSYVDKDKAPYLITDEHIRNGQIKQKASSMLLLTYIAPFFLGQHLTHQDAHYAHFLLMTGIVIISFAPVSDDTTASLLSEMVVRYCEQLDDLYPHMSFKPKCHFLVHLPTQIRDFGPLRYHSCMRYEAKHGYFKSQKCQNFRNTALTLSARHQLNLAHQMTRADGCMAHMFFNIGQTLGRGAIFRLEDVNEELRGHLLSMHTFSDKHAPTVYACHRVTRDGLEIRPGICLLLEDDEFAGPTFALVKLILVVGGEEVFLCMRQVMTGQFLIDYNAYEIKLLQTHVVRRFSDLSSLWPLPVTQVGMRKLVTNRQSMFQHF
jgi:hypothetical protein